MPALRNGDVKIINGLRVVKENDDVIYNDEKHLYLDKNIAENICDVFLYSRHGSKYFFRSCQRTKENRSEFKNRSC